ncbi:MAG: glycosyltransferase family 2 protein [Planctomycetota bacterium]
MQSLLISVVVVNLNGEGYLHGCLASLKLQTFRSFEVIVVDNGSKDRSLEILERDFPWVRVIPLEVNTGFASGNNVGIYASRAEYIATLNNDTIVDAGWLQALYDAAETNDRIGMVASKIFLGQEGRRLDSAGMLVYPDGMSRQRGRGEQDNGRFDRVEEVLFPSACAALYRRSMLDEIGLFDEEFVSYCEDSDLGLRARLAGWRAVLAPEARVRHLYSKTGGSYSAFKAFQVERNHLWVLLKDLPVQYILTSAFFTAWRFAVQLYSLVSGKGNAARFSKACGPVSMVLAVVRAYGSALAGAPQALKKRRKIWKGKRLRAGEYRSLLKKYRITAQELILKE